MLGKFFRKKREDRFERMAEKLPDLSDCELKDWYRIADSHSLIGDIREKELELLNKIEMELVFRGFKHMVDF